VRCASIQPLGLIKSTQAARSKDDARSAEMCKKPLKQLKENDLPEILMGFSAGESDRFVAAAPQS
jgi:hypothetical protein